MSYELALATLIGSFSSIITILLWQRGTWKKMSLEHAYNIQRFKLGKKYKMKEAELPKKGNKSLLEQLSKLDKGTISKALEFLAPDEDVGAEDDDLGGILKNVVANNPDMVNQFLQGLSSGTKKSDTDPDNKFFEP